MTTTFCDRVSPSKHTNEQTSHVRAHTHTCTRMHTHTHSCTRTQALHRSATSARGHASSTSCGECVHSGFADTIHTISQFATYSRLRTIDCWCDQQSRVSVAHAKSTALCSQTLRAMKPPLVATTRAQQTRPLSDSALAPPASSRATHDQMNITAQLQ